MNNVGKKNIYSIQATKTLSHDSTNENNSPSVSFRTSVRLLAGWRNY